MKRKPNKRNARSRRTRVTYRYLAQVEIFSKEDRQLKGDAAIHIYTTVQLRTADAIQSAVRKNLDDLTNIDMDEHYTKLTLWLAI